MCEDQQKSQNSKRLSQTKISSYFTGCVKRPVATEITQKIKIKTRNRLNISASMDSVKTTPKKKKFSFEPASNQKLMISTLSIDCNNLINSIEKRKLPVAIISDDEDDGFQSDGNVEKTKSLKKSDQRKTTISVNKNNSIALSPQKGQSWNPTVLSQTKFDENTPSSSKINKLKLQNNISTVSPKKSIKVLQSVVLNSSKRSPQTSFKDETKKVNYEQLKVFRDFYIKVLENKNIHDLIEKNDQECLHKFFSLERDHQYLCIKLFLWKPKWYNIFNFCENIGLRMNEFEVDKMYKTLCNDGFVRTDYAHDDIFSLLNDMDLKNVRDIAKEFKMKNLSGTKDLVITNLIKHCKTQSTLTVRQNSSDILRNRVEKKLGFCVKLSSNLYKCLYYIFILNTFTNASLIEPQDYFTNVTYFNVVFPTYGSENFNIFYTPLEFHRYADAIKLRSELLTAIVKKNNLHIYEICKHAYNTLKQLISENGCSFDSSRRPYLERFTATSQYISVLSKGAKLITPHYFEEVLTWYEYLLSQNYYKPKRAEWYCQVILIHTTYLKNYEKAAEILIKALKTEKEHFSDIHLQELSQKGKILNQKSRKLCSLFHDQIISLSTSLCENTWSQDVLDCKSMKSPLCVFNGTLEEKGRKRMYVHKCENGDVNYLTVEQKALQYYRDQGYPNGEHTEGRLLIAAFCLLFWDVIYDTYVEGAFISKVQNAPLDMYTEYFYTNREDTIRKRLKEIEESWSEKKFKEFLVKNWNFHSHEHSLCQIDSNVKDCDYLYNVLICIGRKPLAKIFERLVKNFKIYNSGFPDLIVWDIQEKKAKFIEVKSENDVLSIKQKLWLNYLVQAGASVAVCHIESISSKKRLKQKKSESNHE